MGMRLRIIRNVRLLVAAVVLVTALLIAQRLQSPGVSTAYPHKPVTVVTTSQAIIRENARKGTTSWNIPATQGATTQIQAYTSAPSVLPGHTIIFYVSTQYDGTIYAIDIYRIGWYSGTGGRLMASLGKHKGHAQGYYDNATKRLIDCPTCTVNRQTGLVEANWQPSYVLRVPPDWITGVYLAKFTDANNIQTYASFIVRGNFHSVYVAVSPDTTYEAYNNWGGYSLYTYNSLNTNGLGRAVKVSFNRPFVDVYGSGYVLFFEGAAIHWLERNGYDVSYISNVDLHNDPAQLLQHRVYLSLGHDEYWTKEMRDGVEYARDHGVSLAFLGANASYWQMRFESDHKGVPDRIVICYKVDSSSPSTLKLDPFYGKDNTRVTAQWRDPVIARPENAMIGIMFSDFTDRQRGYPWELSPQATNLPLLRGTGLQPGVPYGCELVGYEWDRIFSNGATPKGLQVIGLTYTINNTFQSDSSNTTYYIAPSGAIVFATGSVYWTDALDAYRLAGSALCSDRDTVVPGMQKLMANVMYALANRTVNV